VQQGEGKRYTYCANPLHSPPASFYLNDTVMPKMVRGRLPLLLLVSVCCPVDMPAMQHTLWGRLLVP
jgi:hypothetical protein